METVNRILSGVSGGLLDFNRESTPAVPTMTAKADVCIEAVVSDNPRDGDAVKGESPGDERSELVALGKEQHLIARIKVQSEDTSIVQRSQTHLVLVVDQSGSMAGHPWNQVKESMHAIISSCGNLPHIKIDLLLYNSEARAVPFSYSNYKQVIDGLFANGSTNFVSAFRKVYETVSGAGPEYTSTVIVFLTDGYDTVNNAKDVAQLIPKMRKGFLEKQKHATVHTVGFYKGHDFKFLKTLSDEGGTSPGMFRYCEPSDNKDAIQNKLGELFDFIVQGNDFKVNLSIQGGKCLILNRNERTKAAVIQGKVLTNQEEHSQDEVKIVMVEAWLYLEDPSEIPEMSLSIETDVKIDSDIRKINTPCEIENITRKTLDSPAEKTKWRLVILERNIDDLMTQTATAVAQKADISHLQARVEKYQSRVSHTKVFGNGISRDDRQTMFELIKDVQASLDEIQKMLAEYMRSGTDSISLLARAHDMRFQAVFNKSRRQRVMDKRASKNMQHAAEAQKELAKLVVDKDEISTLEQAAMDFYFCVMSQNSVKDMLLSDDVEDAIGFGLAVKRSEVVLDEPTLIRIQVISGTLVSRNAMLDALEYKINVSSQLQAHGGFQFEHNTLGVTTVGTGREPINAWLPLYVTKSHWDRIKVILKPALGSFCTLDPLGYHFKQLDILYMVLGSMIGQLSDDNLGEHQLKLLFSVLRTCSACLEDFEKLQEVTDVVKDFVTNLAGRTKDIVPNLHTIIGYIVALPPGTRRAIFPTEEVIQRFWTAFISEWLRRAAGGIYKDSSLVNINGTVNSLVNGNIDETDTTGIRKPACNYTKELERLCLQAGKVDVEIKPFDPAADVKPPDIELRHSERVDKAMEIWAEKHTGYKKNIGKTKEYKAALRQVNDWKNMKSEADTINKLQNITDVTEDDKESDSDADPEVETETPDTAQDDGNSPTKKEDNVTDNVDFDIENVTDYILHVIAQMHKELTNSAYPNLSTLPGLIAFVNTWLGNEHDVVEIDANSGIAPDGWIEEIKNAVTAVYTQLNAEGTSIVNSEPAENASKEDADIVVTNSANTVEKEDDDIDENDFDDEYYGEDDDNDDDDYGINYNYRMGGKKKKKKTCISLPQIIKLITGQDNAIQTLRAMLCQAIRFNSNSKARAAITSKQLLDIADGQDIVRLVLCDSYRYLDEFKTNARESVVQTALWKRANYCMINATTPWAFVGYLMNTHSSRNDGFTDLIDLFMTTVTDERKIPYLKEKVHILLTGKYEECAVLDNGNQWLPEKKMATHFKKLLGEEIWGEFELELRSSVQIHVYRESDIPNRHGHCNSNPYIPNFLRRKLGMKLLPESKAGTRSRRRR